jgi:PAS domain S-box-containing protein
MPTPPAQAAPTVAEVLRRSRPMILDDWEAMVRELPAARGLERPALIDHVPQLLERIADVVDQLAHGDEGAVPLETAEIHAGERLELGFDLSQVVAEYAALREVVIARILRERTVEERTAALRIVNRAIDGAIAASVDRYAKARERALTAMDRISSAALESRDTDALLRRLLAVFVETTSAVDTVALLFREGDRLVVRASAGLEEEWPPGASLRVGEGFSGSIAQSGKPLELYNAEHSDLVKGTIIRKKGIKTLYGVPLVDGGDVVGVAHMGSQSALQFSTQDKRLFAALATRATATIFQQMLRERLELERGRFLDLVNNLDYTVIWVAAACGRLFSFVSARAEAVTGFTPEEWRASTSFWAEHIPAEDQARVLETFDTSRAAEKEGRCSHRFVAKDGRTLWMQTGVHFMHRNGVGVFRGATVDVTPLQEALRTREEVLAIVSHDLRGPLGVLMNAAWLISVNARDATKQPVIQRSADTSIRVIKGMTRLIDDLMDFASIQAGRLSVQRVPTDLNQVVGDVVTSTSGLAVEKGLDLVANLPEPLPSVPADRDRIFQIFSNLVGNAIKLTPPGGFVQIGGRPRKDEVLLSVTDSGPGISPEELPRLFDRYWRAEGQRHKGAGLGLAIAKGLVEAHGGRIWAESEPGAGATFYFTLATS